MSVRVGTPSSGARLVQIFKGISISLIRHLNAHIPNRAAEKSSQGLANIPGQNITKIACDKTTWKNKTGICSSTYFVDLQEKIINVDI